MDAQPMVIPVDAAPCGQVRPFIDFLVERFASQPEHPCYRAARRLSAFDGQRATFEGSPFLAAQSGLSSLPLDASIFGTPDGPASR
jgi:hypothetical protein